MFGHWAGFLRVFLDRNRARQARRRRIRALAGVWAAPDGRLYEISERGLRIAPPGSPHFQPPGCPHGVTIAFEDAARDIVHCFRGRLSDSLIAHYQQRGAHPLPALTVSCGADGWNFVRLPDGRMAMAERNYFGPLPGDRGGCVLQPLAERGRRRATV